MNFSLVIGFGKEKLEFVNKKNRKSQKFNYKGSDSLITIEVTGLIFYIAEI